MAGAMLEVRDLHLDYDGVVALSGVDLDVHEGEAVALVGSNGAGKSSLLAAVSGMHRPVRGSITFEGTEIARLPSHRIVPLGPVLVPEGRRLFGQLTVRKNLLMGAYHRRDHKAVAEDLDMVVDLLPVLGERMQTRTASLSGGQQQMVAVGRALMARPRLLMLDEPSLGIAPIVVRRLFESLRAIRERGTTVLLVEQNLHLSLEFADRAYVLQTGRVTVSGPAAEIAASDDVRKAYLGM